MRRIGLMAAVWALAAAPLTAVAAGDGPLVVGVFLPVSVADGQQRFQIAEKMASRLTETLGQPVTGRSFGRFQDFSEALATGAITVGLVDGWVAGQLPASIQPLAVGVPTDRQRLQLVSKTRRAIPELKGTTLAVVRGAPGMEAKMATNFVFSGDLPAHTHFKLVSVPNVESALEALAAGAAESAILPSASAKGLEVLFSAPTLPAAFLVRGGKGAAPAGLVPALLKLELPSLERFVAARGDELSDLRARTARAPRRVPMLVELPPARFELDLLDVAGLEPQLPPLAGAVSLPTETPDD